MGIGNVLEDPHFKLTLWKTFKLSCQFFKKQLFHVFVNT